MVVGMIFGYDTSQLEAIIARNDVRFGLTVILLLVAAYVVTYIIRTHLLKIAKKTKTQADDTVIEKAGGPFVWLLFFMGTQASIGLLGLSEPMHMLIQSILRSVVVVLVMYVVLIVINVAIDMWGERLVQRTKSTADDALLGITHRLINIIGIALATVMIFQIWGIEVGPIVASLGIAGIAVAFALQSTLGNIFGGVSMIVDKTYRVGDWVDVSGVNGIVQDVGIRATKIRTWDNEIVTVPNGKAAESLIKNYTMPTKKIRVNVEFSVAYGSDIQKVRKVVLERLKKKIKNLILDDEKKAPYVLFTKLNSSSLDFVARFWIADVGEKLFTQERALEETYSALRAAKIQIPFPQMDVHLKKK